jgi:hypothetical protein
VYRVTHLFLMDTLIDEPRDKLLDWLTTVEQDGIVRVVDPKREPHVFRDYVPLWKRKTYELLTCPFCFSVHVAWVTVLLHDAFIDPNLPYPMWYWVALSTSSLLVWKYVDGDDE